MGHARLVAQEGSQMDGFLGVILGESLDFSAMASRSLPGQEAKGAMARRFVLDDRRLTSVVSQGRTGFYRPYDGSS
jgi:hypothetical protein